MNAITKFIQHSLDAGGFTIPLGTTTIDSDLFVRQNRRLMVADYRRRLQAGNIASYAEGVTPFMIGCRASRVCLGMMESAFYTVPQERIPTHAWRQRKSGGETLALHELSAAERMSYLPIEEPPYAG